jgi:hypothetical protein
MLAGGFAPCLQPWPIEKVKLQGRYAGFETDDLIVFTKSHDGAQTAKLLAQVKHSVSITDGDANFGEVMQAAWNDFRNPNLFDPKYDAIALITGPITSTDMEAKDVLEWARYTENAEELLKKVELAKFSSDTKRAKLNAFRTHLVRANEGQQVADEDFWRFLKAFHLLGYDLDIKAGVTLSLLHSLIGQYSLDGAQSLWLKILDEVQSANKNAGTLTRKSITRELGEAFTRKAVQEIPSELAKRSLEAEPKPAPPKVYDPDLATANLLGAWNESSEADKNAIESLTRQTYSEWVGYMRNIFLQPGTPLAFENGKWRIPERLEVWYGVGQSVFDNTLDDFCTIAEQTLKERDPKFELPSDERFASAIRGKVLEHSSLLRKGIAETLALLGSHPEALSLCSRGKAVACARSVVRDVLSEPDWVLWASLEDYLPLLAEAAPEEFLERVEKGFKARPCPFDVLFEEETGGIGGKSYIAGLLWALETLAWDSNYLVRVSAILGNLAFNDPGGSWANRPANSLSTILLPWLPRTCASVDKRIAACKLVLREHPKVGWALLLALLPETHQSSSGTRRPKWRDTIPADWKEGVPRAEYWRQVDAYSLLAVDEAERDLERTELLVERIANLTPAARERLLRYIESDSVSRLPDERRVGIWNRLLDVAARHKRYAEQKWAIDGESITRIESATAAIAPESPIYRHQRLFAHRYDHLLERKGDYATQRQEVQSMRGEAVAEIYAKGDLELLLSFAHVVESPRMVGYSIGISVESVADTGIIPVHLASEDSSVLHFARGFVDGRYRSQSWAWVDSTDVSKWSDHEKGLFFACLPFQNETWRRVSRLLSKDESPYWEKADVNTFEIDENLELAVDRLIKFDRSHEAVRCLEYGLQEKMGFDTECAIRALDGTIHASNTIHMMDSYAILEVIKALQEDEHTNPEALLRIEWNFLGLLDEYHDASPKLLQRGMAQKPEFFCEVIGCAFRSKNEREVTDEPSDHERNVASRAFDLLNKWRLPPGRRDDGGFDGDVFAAWLSNVKEIASKSGHLEIALIYVGHVLVYAPEGEGGLWLPHAVAEALEAEDAEDMRDGYCSELFNSRGTYEWTHGEDERKLAAKYKKLADDVDTAGYYKLAHALRSLAGWYDIDSQRQKGDFFDS